MTTKETAVPERVSARAPKRRVTSKAGPSSKRRKANCSAVGGEEDDNNEVKDYLKKVDDFKDSIDETLKASKLASWPATRLRKHSSKLSEEQEKRLLKKGNFKEALKQTEAAI